MTARLPGHTDLEPASRLALDSIPDIIIALRGTTPVGRSPKQGEILDAAVELFAARGFKSVGMRQLAASVGLSAPGIYAHFDSKESLVAAAMRQALARFLEIVLPPAHGEQEQDRLDGLIRRHVRFQLENLALAKANDQLMDSNAMRRFLPADDHAILLAARRAYYDVLRDLIHGQAPTATGEQVRLAAFAILAMCERVTTWYRPDRSLTVTQVAERYSRLARTLVASLEGAA